MVERIDELVNELLSLLRERGRIELGELLEWGRERGIHLALTLYILVAEVKEHKDIEVAPEEELVDPEYNITLPKWIAYRGAEPSEPPATQGGRKPGGEAADNILAFFGIGGSTGKPAERKEVRKRRGGEKKARKQKTSGKPRGGNLLVFFQAGEEEEGEGEGEVEEKKAVEEEAEKREIEEDVSEALEKVKDLLEDERYLKAIRYLSRYWSVGLYRFYKDLEKSGVENPQEILKTLYRRGLVEIAELEVINAGPEIRALKEKLRKSPSLAEIFGG